MPNATVLLADDDASIRLVISQTLSSDGHTVRATTNPGALLKWVKSGEGDVLITDVYMGDECIFDYLPDIRLARPELPVIVISGQSTLLTATSAADGGAFDYLPKPFSIDELASKVRGALTLRPEAKTVRSLDRQAERDEQLPLIGRSTSMQSVFRVISRVKNTSLTVLLEGESGTGKELAARAIHTMGNRKDGEFVAINLAAVPRDRIDAELFGTIADDGTYVPGKADRADQGTLFLDEIGDMPEEAQTRLLRFLQNGEYTPAGSSETRVSNARVIASTKENLLSLIESGAFREDLFFRLNVVTLQMPPLRSRSEDVPDLTRAFLIRASKDGLPKKTINEKALSRLKDYQWPGNVRELENLIQRLSILTSDSEITEDLVLEQLQVSYRRPTDADLSFDREIEVLIEKYIAPVLFQSVGRIGAAEQIAESVQLDESGEPVAQKSDIHHSIISSVERPLIKHALLASKGNKVKAAALLGLNRNTLRSKISTLDIA